MRARLLQLTRLTAGYGLAALVGPIFTIVLTPLYTRVLRPADYAVLDTLMTIGLLATAIGGLGLNAAISVFFHDGDAAHQRRVVATAAALGMGWSLLLGLALAAAARPVAAAAFGDEAHAVLLYLTAFNLPFSALVGIIQAALRLRLAVGRANALVFAHIGLMVALNILLVLVLRLGVLGIQITTVVVTLALTLVGGAMLLREGWGGAEEPAPSAPGALAARAWAQHAAPLLRAGLPFVPAGLALWALAYLDRLILPAFGVGLDDRGLYGLAAKLASMLALVSMPFQNAWAPLALSIRGQPEAPRTYVKVLTYFTAGALGLGLGLALFAREILLIFTTPAYAGAAPLVAPLTYVGVSNGVGVAAGIGLYLAKRTDLAGLATLAGAAANLLLNLLLIPPFGVWGAAWATAIGYAVVPAALYLGAQRVYPLPFELPKLLAALGAQAALLLLGLGAASDTTWQTLALRLLLVAAYPAALLLLRVIEPAELRALAQVVLRRGPSPAEWADGRAGEGPGDTNTIP